MVGWWDVYCHVLSCLIDERTNIPSLHPRHVNTISIVHKDTLLDTYTGLLCRQSPIANCELVGTPTEG